VRAGTSAIPKPESGLADEHAVVDPEARHRAHHPRPRPALKPPVGFLMPVEDRPMAFEHREGGPSSPTAGDPCSGACAARAYAAPRAAAGACRQASTPTRVRASGRDVTAPLLDTLPLAAPDTTPLWISTPKLELGSQAPRRVVICTVQLPSKREAACAVSLAAVPQSRRPRRSQRLKARSFSLQQPSC
jgi:hypothetical protein